MKTTDHLVVQTSGQLVDQINVTRIAEELRLLDIQNEFYKKAMGEMAKVRDFVGSPSTIIGNDNTKHGEIAEQMEVGVKRAWQIFKRQKPTIEINNVSRNAAYDYVEDGLYIQSKFYNGLNNTLRGVSNHLDTYQDFASKGFYRIPKDQYDLLQKVMAGETIEGLNAKSVAAMERWAATIEQGTGKPWNEAIQPSTLTYAEVQQGRVHFTIDGYETEITKANDEVCAQIQSDHEPSLAEGLSATAQGAAVGAGVSLVTCVYQKWKEGKKFYKGDFTQQDWCDVGLKTGQGAVLGGLSGASIYGLTNFASLSAPLAGAVVCAAKGVQSLHADYRDGKISKNEFAELGMILCSETALVACATVAGQALIPIPALGAVMGSMAGSLFANFLSGENAETVEQITRDLDQYLDQLDEIEKSLVDQILMEYRALGDITEAAFDLDYNARTLSLSIELARAYGVADKDLLQTVNDVDDYMML